MTPAEIATTRSTLHALIAQHNHAAQQLQAALALLPPAPTSESTTPTAGAPEAPLFTEGTQS